MGGFCFPKRVIAQRGSHLLDPRRAHDLCLRWSMALDVAQRTFTTSRALATLPHAVAVGFMVNSKALQHVYGDSLSRQRFWGGHHLPARVLPPLAIVLPPNVGFEVVAVFSLSKGYVGTVCSPLYEGNA